MPEVGNQWSPAAKMMIRGIPITKYGIEYRIRLIPLPARSCGRGSGPPSGAMGLRRAGGPPDRGPPRWAWICREARSLVIPGRGAAPPVHDEGAARGEDDNQGHDHEEGRVVAARGPVC